MKKNSVSRRRDNRKTTNENDVVYSWESPHQFCQKPLGSAYSRHVWVDRGVNGVCPSLWCMTPHAASKRVKMVVSCAYSEQQRWLPCFCGHFSYFPNHMKISPLSAFQVLPASVCPGNHVLTVIFFPASYLAFPSPDCDISFRPISLHSHHLWI